MSTISTSTWLFYFSLFLILFQSTIISSAVLTTYKRKEGTAVISKFECIKRTSDNTGK